MRDPGSNPSKNRVLQQNTQSSVKKKKDPILSNGYTLLTSLKTEEIPDILERNSSFSNSPKFNALSGFGPIVLFL